MTSSNVRELMRAIALGDNMSAQEVNDRMTEAERADLGIYATAVLSVCLDHQFGDDHSRETIDAFVERMRDNYSQADPPLKPFVIEGIIRAFAGEAEILDDISAEDQENSQFPLIREIVASSPVLQQRMDDLLADADMLSREWSALE